MALGDRERTSISCPNQLESQKLPFHREWFGNAARLCPAAQTAESRLVPRPLFPAVTGADQDDVLRALDKVFAHYAR